MMITVLSEKTVLLFIAQGILYEQDKEVYAYCFEILFATLLNLCAVLGISIVSNTVPETVFFLLSFIPLRQAAGGYHAQNHFRCFLILMGVYSLFLFIVNNLTQEYIAVAIRIGLPMAVLILFLLSPMEDANKPLSNEEVKRLRKRSRISVTLYAAFVLILQMLYPGSKWAFAVLLGIVTVALSLLATAVKQAVEKRQKT